MTEYKRVLLIDGLNALFLRNYFAKPTLDSQGRPAGAIAGGLESLQKFIRITHADFVLVVWDGAGGSSRRRQEMENYKNNRKPPRLNREYALSPAEEEQNKEWQLLKLIDYLDHFPVLQVMFDNTEADDVIALATKLSVFDKSQIVIVSSDKDFIQLITNRIILFRPTQDEVLAEKTAVEKYGIHPKNFALARAMSGDKSDNIEGLGNVGLLTAAKRFPMLAQPIEYSVRDLIAISENAEKKLKVYENVLSQQEKLTRNFDLMRLDDPKVSAETKLDLEGQIKKFSPTLKKSLVLSKLTVDGILEDRLLDFLFGWSANLVYNSVVK